MAQYRLNAYDADVFIPEFRGLYQAGDQMGSDLRYSPDCMNVECIDGVLQPVTRISGTELKYNNDEDPASLTVAEATLMYLRDTVKAGAMLVNIGGITDSELYTKTITENNDYDKFVILAQGHLYKINVSGALKEVGEYNIGTGAGTFSGNDVDWTTYETTYMDSAMQQHKKNTIVFAAPSAINRIGTVCNEAGTALNAFTENITCVARYAERVWAAGGYTVFYSRPFSSTDWTQDNDDPANGGGEISLPTFDRDEIVAMKPLGDSLIIFSRKRAWKLSGTDPTNFIIQEQYGNGVSQPRTVVAMGKQIIMAGEEGLVAYDGYQVMPILRGQTKELFRQIKFDKKPLKATRIGSRYLLTFAGEVSGFAGDLYDVNETGHLEHSVPCDMNEGYKLLIYDENDGSVTLRSVPEIISFCGDQPYVMYRSGNKTYIGRLNFDSWYQHKIANVATRWVTPWITLGREDIKKGGFELYFTPEVEAPRTLKHQYWIRSEDEEYPVQENTEAATYSGVQLKISIQTEKKVKTKTYTVQPLTAAELLADKKHKMKRLHFGGTGRRFRVIIQTEAGNTIPWRLIGGIQIVAETDAD